MRYAEHPVSQFFDHVAGGHRPSQTEIDDLARDLTRQVGCELTPDQVATRLELASLEVLRYHADGNPGHGRNIGHEAGRTLVADLPHYTPPSRSEGMTVAEIVATVPRGGGF